MEKNIITNSLIKYAKEGRYPLHMPGHKRNTKMLPDMDIFDIDITEIEGFDNLHDAGGIIKESMEGAAGIYGTKKTYYLVGGSTCGILASIFAVTKEGDRILIGRGCHKSVYNAIELRNLKVDYIWPEMTEDGIIKGYSADSVREALKSNRYAAVVITSPTYDGVLSDIEEIAKAAHEMGTVLIVDEAHGAHLGFSDDLPRPAYRLGADIVIESTHKTLPAPTQTGVLHIASMRVKPEAIERYLSMFQSSSPSYVLMSGIERAITFMNEHGSEKLGELLTSNRNIIKNVNNFEHFSAIDNKIAQNQGFFDFDETKLVIVSKYLSGYELADILRKEYNFEVEMAAPFYVLAITTVCDRLEKLKEFEAALKDLDERIKKGEFPQRERPKAEFGGYDRPKTVLSVLDVLSSEMEMCDIENSFGRIAAGYVCPYPPGIPLFVPGEVITEKTRELLMTYKELGADIIGMYGQRIPVIK